MATVQRDRRVFEQLDLESAASDYCLRSTQRRPTVRHPSDGKFKADDHIVLPIDDDTTAKRFIEEHHYSGRYVAAVQRYGLWHRGSAGPDQLVGVAVLSAGAPNSLIKAFPGLVPYRQSLDFGRFVLLDQVPANGESWFIGQMQKQAAAGGISGLTSFADMFPRYASDGKLIFPGHFGIIYQATNAVFTGRTSRKTVYLLNDGSELDPIGLSKIFSRPKKQGWRYVEERLENNDIPLPQDDEQRGEWLTRCMEAGLLRRFTHPGTLRYCYQLGTPSLKRGVEIGYSSHAYPKPDEISTHRHGDGAPLAIGPPVLRGAPKLDLAQPTLW